MSKKPQIHIWYNRDFEKIYKLLIKMDNILRDEDQELKDVQSYLLEKGLKLEEIK